MTIVFDFCLFTILVFSFEIWLVDISSVDMAKIEGSKDQESGIDLARPGLKEREVNDESKIKLCPASLKAEAKSIAKVGGTTLNQFINVAVAEKLSALRRSAYFRSRASGMDIAEAILILEPAGTPGQIQEGDELVSLIK